MRNVFFLLTVVTAVSNRASSFLTIHRLLSETSTNSSQSDTLHNLPISCKNKPINEVFCILITYRNELHEKHTKPPFP